MFFVYDLPLVFYVLVFYVSTVINNLDNDSISFYNNIYWWQILQCFGTRARTCF